MKVSKNKILIFLISCVIIYSSNIVYADSDLTLREFDFSGKVLKIYTDAIRYHVKANGYENKYKDDLENNFYRYTSGPGQELQTERAKMQGYGNYVMKPETCLFDFIAYCKGVDSARCDVASTYLSPPNVNYCDYTKLVSYKGKTLSGIKTTHMNSFWTLMASEDFKRYQDKYYYSNYTNKVVVLSGFSLGLLSNISDYIGNGSKEFLTVCTTYSYAIGKDSAPNFEVKKGDMVPFLYVKERREEDNDSYIDDEEFEQLKNNPYEIARYAYVALIEGWADNIDNNNLWEEEYQAVFNEQYNSDNLIADIDTLSEWYTECKDKYKTERGNKGNNLIGSNLDTIIASDYSISQQIEAVDWYLQHEVKISNYKENMARNELMAKYMMQNSKIDGTIKDYNVGINFITENLQRGTQEPKNTKTVVLSDFQVIELDHTLDKDGQSDSDGISDLTELTGRARGDISTTRIKWVEITGALRKTYIEKHGSEVGFEDEMERLFVANGGNREQGLVGQFDYREGKAYYRTTDYISNPVLMDTDFDGIDDNKEISNNDKTIGRFKGNSGGIGKTDYTNDFRYFFVDNNKYNDELAVMSLMIANGNFINTDQVNANDIQQYLQKIGFTNIWQKDNFRISESENIRGKLYIGKKTIQYRVYASKNDNVGHNAYKEVYGIFLMDFDNETNMKYLLANFDTDEIEGYYDNISLDIDEYVDSYMASNPSSSDYCFWLTGYSIAGGIASHVSPYLISKSETYAYTFGAPNTTTGGSTANANIKNIINEDDVIPKVLNRDEGYSRVGALYNDSIFDNLKKEYRELIGNVKNYEAYPKKANTIKKAIKDIRIKETTEMLKDRALTLLSKYLNNYEYIHDEMTMSAYPEMSTYLNPSVKKVKDGHSIKSYYVLAKSLNGFDLNNEDTGWSEVDDVPSSEDTDNNEEPSKYVVNAIKLFGEWYIKHVSSYQNTPKRSRATQEANDYWDLYQNDSSRIKKSGFGENAVYKYLEDDEDIESGLGYDETKYIVKDPNVTSDFANRKPYNLNKEPNFLGDYCAEFAIAVIQYLSNGRRGNVEIDATKAKQHEYGIFLHTTSANTMYGAVEKVKSDGSIEMVDKAGVVGSLNFYNAMYNLGFKRYFAKDMTVNDLQPGDLLVSDNHVEFYFGYENLIDENGDEVMLKINKSNNRALSTFGWGDVQNRFPFINYFFYKEGDNFKLNRSGDIDENEYKVVWRLEN